MGLNAVLGVDGYTVVLDPDDGVIAKLSTDASGNVTVLVDPKGVYNEPICVGEFYAKPTSFTSITTGAPVKVYFANVIKDTFNCYNATDGTIDIPLDITHVDVEYSVEMASVASTFGSNAGTSRALLMNDFVGGAIIGLGALSCTKVGMDGGSYTRNAMRVITDPVALGLTQVRINPRFTQDPGVTIRIGDSSGTGVSQTYIKMRMYRA